MRQVIQILILAVICAHPCHVLAENDQKLKKLTAGQIALLRSQIQQYKIGDDPSDLGSFAMPFLKHDFSSFQASNYLKSYQALTYLLASQNKSISTNQKQKFLQQSLGLLDSVRFETKKQSFDSDYWRRQVIDELINISYSQGAYFKVIKYAQMLANRPVNDQHLYLVAVSYFETKQLTRFQRLILKHPHLLEKIEAQENIQNRKIFYNLRKKLALKQKLRSENNKRNNSRSVDNKIPEWSDFLGQTEESYFGDHLPSFRKFISRYLEALESKDKISIHRSFVAKIDGSLKKLPPDLVLYYIRKMWQRQHLDRAIKASDLFLSSFKGHPDYSIVAYDLGRILEDQGSHKKAFKSLTINEKWIRGTSHEENLDFRMAWLAYLSKKENASKLFESYLKKYPRGDYYSACFYFLIVLKSRNHTNVKSIRDRVVNFISHEPMNYYSLRLLKEWQLPKNLVMNQLGGSKKPINNYHKSNHIFSLGLKDQHLWDLYLELREFGLHEDAFLVLSELSERLSKSPEWFAYSLGQAKQFEHPSFVTIKGPQVFYKFDALKSFLNWRDIYPLLYREQIADSIKKLNSPLKYEFVVSLIRQESAFNPVAISSANANGLMQIIPSTAKILAKKLNLDEYDIFEPGLNIKLGISLLNRLFYKYDGRIDYMLSAYNAGDAVTDRWIRRRGGLSQIQFIESIPYKETRNYIKLIFRNMEFYKLIYNEKLSSTG
ncbi:MAG: lytic transglycosylase domain-containing protein [Oligoflexales bacterium]